MDGRLGRSRQLTGRAIKHGCIICGKLARFSPGITEYDQGCIAPMKIVLLNCNNIFVLLMLGVFLAAMPAASCWSDTTIERLVYPARGENIELAGELTIPEGRDGRLPAVIIVHGSSGVGTREAGWASFLRQSGYATFVIDYFGPRGITSKSPTQPTPVGDVFEAILRLGEHPRIDPTRIAVIGFSRGAVMSIEASNDGGRSTGGIQTAVHVAMYPGCRRGYIDNNPTLPPLLILLGTEDSYTTPDECQRLVSEGVSKGRTVELMIYAGATHAWDASFDGTFYHQAANRTVTIRSSQEFTGRARSEVITFLARILQQHSGLPGSESEVKGD
jgi:dienelactone hydrolase